MEIYSSRIEILSSYYFDSNDRLDEVKNNQPFNSTYSTLEQKKNI